MRINTRKMLSLFLCVLLVLSMFTPVFGATADYGTHWAKADIESAIQTGIAKGYPDGSFRPDNSITRAEFFSLVNNSFKFTKVSTITYTDVSNDAWYAPVIARAQAAGYISGYPDGSIHPNGNITRQEAASIISRVKSLTAKGDSLAFTDASLIASWSKQAIIAVFEAKIMSGYPDGSFKPQAQLKRAEALVTVNNTFKFAGPIKVTDIVYDKAGTYGSTSDVVTIEGNVFIKAPGITLQNTIIKGNLTIAKEVGNGDVILKSVVVQGNTYVNGGGSNSIYFVDVTTGKVYVQKDDGPVRIVASGSSVIAELLAGSDVKLEEVNLTGAGFQAIIVEKTAAGGIDITLVGVKCDSITILAVGVTLTLDATSTVNTLTVDAVGTAIKGTGVITTAIINASGVTFEKAPTTIVTAPGVTAPVITVPVASGGSGSGGGSGDSGGGSVATAPAISATSTITNGAINLVITVTGGAFRTGVTASDLTVTTGTTGLTLGTVTYTSSSAITVTFTGATTTGAITAGAITVQAKVSAFNPVSALVSNTLTINIPAAPVIATVTTITNGAINPVVTITGAGFKSGISASDLTVALGTTGLTLGTVTYVSATQITVAFTGTAVNGAITILAKPTAYNPMEGQASNALTITVP